MNELVIAEGDWKRDLPGRLRVVIHVNGCPMHLEAHEVVTTPTGEQGAPPGESGSDFNELHTAFSCQEPLQTIQIRGRTYALFAHAFGD
jgi:hypothetical protein